MLLSNVKKKKLSRTCPGYFTSKNETFRKK